MDVNFNDLRCGDGRVVCPTDPLLFTCMVSGSTANRITVRIENVLDIDLNEDNTIDGDLPDGFTVQSRNVQTNAGSLDYTLVLSIVSASLLNGSLIICDSNILGVGDVMAGCPVAGKLYSMCVNIGYTTPTRWFSGYTLRVHSTSSVYTKPLSGCSVTGLYHRSHRDQRNRCS